MSRRTHENSYSDIKFFRDKMGLDSSLCVNKFNSIKQSQMIGIPLYYVGSVASAIISMCVLYMHWMGESFYELYRFWMCEKIENIVSFIAETFKHLLKL